MNHIVVIFIGTCHSCHFNISTYYIFIKVPTVIVTYSKTEIIIVIIKIIFKAVAVSINQILAFSCKDIFIVFEINSLRHLDIGNELTAFIFIDIINILVFILKICLACFICCAELLVVHKRHFSFVGKIFPELFIIYSYCICACCHIFYIITVIYFTRRNVNNYICTIFFSFRNNCFFFLRKNPRRAVICMITKIRYYLGCGIPIVEICIHHIIFIFICISIDKLHR